MESVTQVLPFDGDHIHPDVLAFAAERGRKAHKAIHIYDTAVLDVEALDPVLLPYVIAWTNFVRDTGWKTERSEFEVKCAKHQYIGHPDKYGRFTSLTGKTRRRTILDIKCTAEIAATTALQTAAYACGDRTVQRCVVQLKPDESYRLKFYDSPEDYFDFLAMLRAYRWKKRNGYLTEENTEND